MHGDPFSIYPTCTSGLLPLGLGGGNPFIACTAALACGYSALHAAEAPSRPFGTAQEPFRKDLALSAYTSEPGVLPFGEEAPRDPARRRSSVCAPSWLEGLAPVPMGCQCLDRGPVPRDANSPLRSEPLRLNI